MTTKGDRIVEGDADKLHARADTAEAKTDEEPGAGARRSPGRAQLGSRPSGKGGPNPFVVAGAAFAVGTVLAKLIDWRGHAHPRR